MDWIKVPVRIRDDPRVGILAEKLGVSYHEALGRLVHVMTWCADHETRQLPASLDGVSRTALRDAGLIGPEGLVDWEECASSLVSSRTYERERKARYRRKLLENHNNVPGTSPKLLTACPPQIEIENESSTREEDLEKEKVKVKRTSATVPAAERGQRLEDSGFTLLTRPEAAEYAMLRGATPQQVDDLFVEFWNYWTSRAGREARKIDWFKVWQNRVLTKYPHPSTPKSAAPKIDREATKAVHRSEHHLSTFELCGHPKCAPYVAQLKQEKARGTTD